MTGEDQHGRDRLRPSHRHVPPAVAHARRPRRGNARRPRRRPVHGGAGPSRHRHDQPGPLGSAPRVRLLSDPRGLGRAQRRHGGIRIQARRVSAARAVFGAARDGVARRRAFGAGARSRAAGPAAADGSAPEPALHLRLEYRALQRLPRGHGRLPRHPAQPPVRPPRPRGGPDDDRLPVAVRAHHRHRHRPGCPGRARADFTRR